MEYTKVTDLFTVYGDFERALGDTQRDYAAQAAGYQYVSC